MSVNLKSFASQLRALKKEGLSAEAALVFMQMQFQYHQDTKLRQRVQSEARKIDLILKEHHADLMAALGKPDKPDTVVPSDIPHPRRKA